MVRCIKKSVAFIFESPVLVKNNEWYAFDAFENAGYKIKMADISRVTAKAAHDEITSDLMDYKTNDIVACSCYNDIYNFIKNLDIETIVITVFGWRVDTNPILRCISKCRLRYGYMNLNGGTFSHIQRYSIKDRISLYMHIINLKNICNSIMVRLPRRFMRFDRADFVIVNYGTEDTLKKINFCDKETRFLRVHSVMLETAIKKGNFPRLVKNKYCVFLDTYDPYHADFKLEGINTGIDPVSYYGSMEKFFKWIEREYQIRVVVAAHPRSKYVTHPEAFRGYKIIKYKTDELVRDCEFAFMTNSTSYLYTVMYHKPLALITMKAMQHEYLTVQQNYMADFLHKHIIDVDLPYGSEFRNKFQKELDIDEKLYAKIMRLAIDPNYDGELDVESYNKSIISHIEKGKSLIKKR